MRLRNILILIFTLAFLSCGNRNLLDNPDNNGFGNTQNDGDLADSDSEIHEYSGEKADDKALDIVDTDPNSYWEVNEFTDKVKVIYNGT